jgi:hypothetical protein
MNIPELTEDAVIELAREGGGVYPTVERPAQNRPFRSHTRAASAVIDVLQQALPRGFPPGQTDSPGRGDQRYFRIQIIWTHHNQAHYTDIILLVPEQEAPPSLVDLWKGRKRRL